MRLVMTLLVRDEADIIGEHIAFHLAAGVDFFVATDHDSKDNSTAVLERYAAQGVLHLLRESGSSFQQSRWVTRMARLAATEFGADWVINSDADEFWWPSGGNLKEVLSRVPSRYGAAYTFVRTFIPGAGEGPFFDCLLNRLVISSPINDPATSFRGGVRLCHRASADVVVSTGNVAISGPGLEGLRSWPPIEVLHFPIRSYEQFERKFLAHYMTVGGERVDHGRARRYAQLGRLRALYGDVYAGEDLIERGLREGALVVDTRLRDALRSLAAEPGRPLTFPERHFAEKASIAVEGGAVEEAELVRFARQLDEAERRVASLGAAERRR